ncbi:MAG: 16S rRNA (guanine(966)-N(2))-methyltransferase RsmD [Nitrospirales bacterium]|nr:16S rRNA (guanine(966)-N(2))-methyltransferase RsmD [Nitrospirales bacterium]
MLRVIAGSQKGRRLQGPTGNHIRPTSGRVREALFSILADHVPQARVLDLCCGVGTIGLEALSRGAARVVFVDHHQDSLLLLRRNLAQWGNPEEATVLCGDAWKIRQIPQVLYSGPYDMIYVDPPYRQHDFLPLLCDLGHERMLSPQGTIIVEHFWKTDMPSFASSLKVSRTQRYGDTMLTFYQPTFDSHANRRLSRDV